MPCLGSVLYVHANGLPQHCASDALWVTKQALKVVNKIWLQSLLLLSALCGSLLHIHIQWVTRSPVPGISLYFTEWMFTIEYVHVDQKAGPAKE